MDSKGLPIIKSGLNSSPIFDNSSCMIIFSPIIKKLNVRNIVKIIDNMQCHFISFFVKIVESNNRIIGDKIRKYFILAPLINHIMLTNNKNKTCDNILVQTIDIALSFIEDDGGLIYLF